MVNKKLEYFFFDVDKLLHVAVCYFSEYSINSDEHVTIKTQRAVLEKLYRYGSCYDEIGWGITCLFS